MKKLLFSAIFLTISSVSLFAIPSFAEDGKDYSKCNILISSNPMSEEEKNQYLTIREKRLKLYQEIADCLELSTEQKNTIDPIIAKYQKKFNEKCDALKKDILDATGCKRPEDIDINKLTIGQRALVRRALRQIIVDGRDNVIDYANEIRPLLDEEQKANLKAIVLDFTKAKLFNMPNSKPHIHHRPARSISPSELQIKMMTSFLNLDPNQQKQVQEIFKKHENLVDQEISAILSPKQQEKFAKLKTEGPQKRPYCKKDNLELPPRMELPGPHSAIIDMLSKKLNLTSEQQKQVRELLCKQEDIKHQELLAQHRKMEKRMKAEREAIANGIEAILTDEQKAKFAELKKACLKRCPSPLR